jgi:adenine phosphoribosyltransferase
MKMATLQKLKSALRSNTSLETTPSKQTLSDAQYSTGFEILIQGSTSYRDFIIPQLSQVLAPLFNSKVRISILEIGPGPQSVLGSLPDYQRRKIRRYNAFEPNELFAAKLEAWLSLNTVTRSPFPCLEGPPTIHRLPFSPQDVTKESSSGGTNESGRGYDVVLFCHSMYGIQSKRKAIEQALEMLVKPSGGMVVVFHRDGDLHIDGLVCHKVAFCPVGVVKVADDDQVLDNFASFIAGFVMYDGDVHKAVQTGWREVCRVLGHREKADPHHLSFRSPNIMMTFTQHATGLSKLTAQLPTLKGERQVKNREACLHRPAAIYRPTEIHHLQACVRWALKHETGLTVISGGHSGHCVWNNTVSVDMGAFHRAYTMTTKEEDGSADFGCDALVVAEAGCTTGDVVREAMAAGVTVPLGSRPSVGAGLWLQGGIGHLSRLHGLACDAIVGAVLVSVDSGQVLYVGFVPSEHQPAGSVRPKNETDILWALKGAGTSFGIVVSVTFRAYTAPTYVVRNWVVPLSGSLEAQLKLSRFEALIASKLNRDCSADVYLYWDAGQLHLGVTMIRTTTTVPVSADCPFSTIMSSVLEAEGSDAKIVDGVGLFETEMYVSAMHGGHGGGKTSSFKRCLFMKDIGDRKVSERLVAAVEGRPSPLCYLHLLQGGGAINDIAADATAFGCRDWHFACVITGVWPRSQDGTGVARAAVEWVYSVLGDLLPLSSGVYSADLGPDPRDTVIAGKAFGFNRQRLSQLKTILDPRNVLAYTCPHPKAPLGPKLIFLVTGETGAGKDYCADTWVSMFTNYTLTPRAVSISEAIKREYAAATNADAHRLLFDRAYKEQHRPALTAYFLEQIKQNSQLPEEQFLKVVHGAADVGVLFITGMRDKTPVAAFSHLVPNSRLLEIYVQASGQTRRSRKGCHLDDIDGELNNMDERDKSGWKTLGHRPSLIFDNEMNGNEALKDFFETRLLPLVHEDLLRLVDMIHPTPNFPRPNILFRHVLGIAQQPGGLALCTSLLQSHFTGDWNDVAAVACCEAGGIVFASALSLRVNVPLVLIRKVGKLPPPTVSASKSQSHVSSFNRSNLEYERIEVERSAIPKSGPVVVIDDTLATGQTLCAVLQILDEAGISVRDVSVMVVAEFPIHRGRELLCRRGFGRVDVRSLLTFNGA